MSEYARPQEVDLNPVLYTGYGNSEPLTEEEKAAYSKISGWEFCLDGAKLTSQELEDFVQKKLGISFLDITTEFYWIYLEEYDSWYKEFGDTNYTSYNCVSGRYLGDGLYEIECAIHEVYDWMYDCRVRLRQVGEDYQIVSNTYIERLSDRKATWQIKEQTFDVRLEGWGEVTFASYDPHDGSPFNRDVSFALLREGEIIYEFADYNVVQPGIFFDSILAVGFEDYNEDGITDIVILNRYIRSEGGSPYNLLRLYRGGEGEFKSDYDLSDLLNYAGKNTSVAEVVEYIKENYPGGFIGRLE